MKNDESPTNTNEIDLELNEIFDILKHRIRRVVLYSLHYSGNPTASMEKIATEVSNSVDITHKHAITNLRHSHLPRLADSGIIDYDSRTETIRYYEQEQLTKILAISNDIESP